jgi:hypothetical protein
MVPVGVPSPSPQGTPAGRPSHVALDSRAGVAFGVREHSPSTVPRMEVTFCTKPRTCFSLPLWARAERLDLGWTPERLALSAPDLAGATERRPWRCAVCTTAAALPAGHTRAPRTQRIRDLEREPNEWRRDWSSSGIESASRPRGEPAWRECEPHRDACLRRSTPDAQLKPVTLRRRVRCCGDTSHGEVTFAAIATN